MKNHPPTPLDTLLSVLGEPKRRQIFDWVCAREFAAGELHRALGGPTFGAISQHLAKLHAVGLVRVRTSGKNRYYNGDPEALAPLRQWLASHLAHLAQQWPSPPPTDSYLL
jgi:DNA-binding transcriptional ArsR family regulator